jgi:hypothetical protein
MVRKAVIALAAATALAASPAAMAAGAHGFSGGPGIGGGGFGGGHSMSVGGYAAHAGGGQSVGVAGGRSMSLGVSRSMSGGWSRPLGATGAAVTRLHTFAPGQVYSGTRGIYRTQENYGSRSGKYDHLGYQKYAYGYGKDHHHHHHHRHGVVIVGGAYVDYGDDFGSYDLGESDSCWRLVRTDYGWQRVWVCGDYGNY